MPLDKEVVEGTRKAVHKGATIATVAELIQFIEQCAQTLKVIAVEKYGPEKKDIRTTRLISGSRRFCHITSVTSVNGTLEYLLYAGAHRVFNCKRFQAKHAFKQREEVRRLGFCFVCIEKH
ncbi:hypothetical protein M0802_014647 [Mischocyttarus mexicanus]|nr:hypothetical protein M0802_014647 [Mischocyttarus mexicanus]